MIAIWLIKRGIPIWLAQLVAILVAFALLIGAAANYRSHLIDSGIAIEATRRDKIDATNNAAAETKRLTINARIHAAQLALDAARADLARTQKELEDAKAISARRQADLLAGRARERVLVRAIKTPSQTYPGGQNQGGAAGNVDQGASVEADLDPRVAAALERIRDERNSAIKRLDACIQVYDAVKSAADAQ